MIKEDIFTWKQGFEAAREAQRHLTRKEVMDPHRSIRLALALIDACRKQAVWPIAGKDKIWDDKVRRVRERWHHLKKAMD